MHKESEFHVRTTCPGLLISHGLDLGVVLHLTKSIMYGSDINQTYYEKNKVLHKQATAHVLATRRWAVQQWERNV